MQRNRPPSPQTINVLRALAADPAQWRYGYDLATEVHLKSGSLYPILVRLADRDLLEPRGSRAWQPATPASVPADADRPGVRGGVDRRPSRPDHPEPAQPLE
jgi:PadR family transcriptional regulator